MLKYLLILFVLALAIAPLTHFLPSKRQRKLAQLREYAAVHGLFVEFRDLPGSKEAGERIGRKAKQVIYYGLRLPASHNKPRSRQAWVREGPPSQIVVNEALVWRGLGHREVVNSHLNMLPLAVNALGVDESSCGVYWQEDGLEEDVEAIRVALNSWAEVLKLAATARVTRDD